MARHILSVGEDRAEGEAFRTVFKEAARILSDPSLAFVFAPDTLAEVPLTAQLNKKHLLNGIADRLILSDGHVLAVDFKTNATIPDDLTGVPEGILRQLGAYAHALRQIYPDRSVATAILWTRHAKLMEVPDALSRAALDRFLASGGNAG
jgi:ATP-dependent helicase/nuclease subunit A